MSRASSLVNYAIPQQQGIELDWAAGDPQGYSVIADKAKAEAQAARDARKEAREDRKLDQQMSIAQMSAVDRNLTRQLAMLTAQQGAEMNSLKRQEIQQKMEDRTQKKEENHKRQSGTLERFSQSSQISPTLTKVFSLPSRRTGQEEQRNEWHWKIKQQKPDNKVWI